MSRIGNVYPSEKRTFRDSETSAQIQQFTSEGSINRTLYFTNRPYINKGSHLVFLSNRTGRNEMFLLELHSGKIVQLSDLDGQPNASACLHPTRPELYYHNRRTVYRVHLDTLKTEELMRAPDGFVLGIFNLNSPPWLAFELIERIDGISVVKDGSVTIPGGYFEKSFQCPRTTIYRFNVDDGCIEALWGEPRLLTHIQISPTNPDLLIYSNFSGYGCDRVYYLDLSKECKSVPRPLLGETLHSRGGHEAFSRRGNLWLQWIEGDLQGEGNLTLMHACKRLENIPVSAAESAPFEKFHLPEKNRHLAHHFTINSEETWGVHDRWPEASTWQENINWLSLFRHQEEEPQSTFLRLCYQNSHQADFSGLGPNLTIDDTDDYATYTSYLGGRANVCQVYLAPFVEKLFRTKRKTYRRPLTAAEPELTV